MQTNADADRTRGENLKGEPSRQPRQGWYLKCREGDIAERVVLVGDPGRVEIFSRWLDKPRTVNTNRALLAVTGLYRDTPVSVVAFGMGAPILAVVLEEIAWLGAKVVLRAGTAMSVSEDWYGRFIVAEGAYRGEATSLTYVPASYPAVADFQMTATLSQILQSRGLPWGRGIIASYDGFYSQMFALDPSRQEQVRNMRAEMVRMGIAAVDMETAALLSIGRYLGLRCGSFCLVTIDGEQQAGLEGDERERKERHLVEVSLEGVTGFPANALSK